MSNTVQIAVELLAGIGLFALVSLVTAGLRQRCAAGGRDGSGFGRFLAAVSRPVLVLALTKLVMWLRSYCPVCHAWLSRPQRAEHVHAWLVFWVVVLGLALLEWAVLEFYRARGRPCPVPDLMRNIIRGVLLLAAALFVLHLELKINIAPLLGASALVTAVVGFALQGVLGNLLAGISLHITRSAVPGDWVAVGDVEGEVVQTNWRETRLRTVAGHTMIVPNSTVASATLHNMSRPTPLRRHKIEVGASYSDAPGDVIEALLEAARRVPEVLQDPAPSAYVVAYLDFGINYRLRFWTQRYFDRTPVEGDVMRMIWYQFKRRGIEIPFPMSDVVLNDYMTVIQRQKHRMPEEAVGATVADLMTGDFFSKLLVDEKGAPLLKPDQLSGVAEAVRRVRYTRGETVFRQGEPGDTCYVVARGTVRGRVEYKDAAQAHEFDLGPGALFGEMSLVTGLPRTATITAPGEVELLEISKDAFTKLLSIREDIPQVLAKLVADRAAQNAAALDRLQALGANVAETIKRENILTRFLKMLGRGK